MRYPLTVILAVILVAFVAQRVIGPSAETEIEQTIATVATSSDPSYCDKLVTTRYLVQTTGANPPFADDFCRSEAEEPRADSTEVLDTHIDGDRATAVVGFEGGSYNGSRFELRLVKEDGQWKLDRILSFVRFDRKKFDRAYRSLLFEFGVPPRSVECVLGKVRQLSDSEIERAALENSHRLFAPIVVECDRDGIERNLVASVGNRRYGLPPKGVKCAATRIEGARDAELVRLGHDLLAYNELILSCDGYALLEFEKRELPAQGLSPEAVACVVSRSQRLPQTSQIRLIYDEARYDALIQSCK